MSQDDKMETTNNICNEDEKLICSQDVFINDIHVSKLTNLNTLPTSFLIFSRSRLQVAIAVLTRTFTPAVLKIYYIYLRRQQSIIDSVRHQLLPAVIAFLVNNISHSLASVQNRIISKSIKTRAITESSQILSETDETSNAIPERSVECKVLSSPLKDTHVADIIFIHGLHGGVDRTWKQGQWRHDGHKLKHQRPIRHHSSGHLYVPPRRQSLKRTMSEIYWKIPYKSPRTGNQSCVTSSEEVIDCNENIKIDNNDEFSPCWPQDWLPLDCPGVRVIALNYTTDILWCPVWKKKRIRTGMVERSNEMIDELCRLGVGQKPIIWVGHSKGGLFVKQIILNALEKHRNCPRIYDIFLNSKGVMFYSVPHKGSYLADCTLPFLRRSVELIEIRRNCDFVLDLHRRFLNICQEGQFSAEIFSFIETSFTLMSFVYLKIVAFDSADPDIGIKCAVPLDHREICKPAGRDCFLYLELVKMIKKHVFNET